MADMADMADMVNPKHYTDLSPQPIEVIEAWGLGFHEGNALKYLSRWRNKGGIDDLKKARWYLDRLIKKEEQGGNETLRQV